MQHFHELNRNSFSAIVNFNHRYVIAHSPENFTSTLDVGAGLGEHLAYESLTAEQLDGYVALEFRQNMADEIRKKWPAVRVSNADCQRTLPFADGCFDRILAIHVLEHLSNLPSFLDEAHRLLNKNIGRFLVVIPCEGGLAYSLGRRLTSKRMFEKRYGQPYEPYIATEHVNNAAEVVREIDRLFVAETKTYYPLKVPSLHLNLCLGLTLRPIATGRRR